MGYLAAKLSLVADKSQIRSEILEAVAKIVSRVDEIERVFLFGSVLTDKFNEASDVDLAFIFKVEKIPTENKSQIYKLTSSLSHPPDILFYGKNAFRDKAMRGGVSMVINTSGELIYG